MYFRYKSLIQKYDLQIFSPSCGLSFHFLGNVLGSTEDFNFDDLADCILSVAYGAEIKRLSESKATKEV